MLEEEGTIQEMSVDMGNERQRVGGDDKSEKGLGVGSPKYVCLHIFHICMYICA